MDTTTDLMSVEAEWRRLEALPINSLHQGLDWCLAWSRSQQREIVVVRGRAGERTMLLLPLEVVERGGFRVARLPGGRFNNINTGLFDTALTLPDEQDLHHFTQSLQMVLKDRADIVVLDNVPLDWRDTRHPLSLLATIENQNHSFQLPLLDDFDATIAQLSAKNRRKKFRTSTRRLDAIGGYDHVVATERSERHELLDLFFRQKSQRLASFGLPNVFEDREVQDFFHRLLDVPASGHDLPLVLHAIRLRGDHQGHICAIAGMSRKGGHVLCQFSSIDESICPEASPGELLFWLVIEAACRDGATVFDFGVGDQPYKRSWCTRETVQHDILLPITWRGELMRLALVNLTKAKAAIKRRPRLYSTAQRCRAALRKMGRLPQTSD